MERITDELKKDAQERFEDYKSSIEKRALIETPPHPSDPMVVMGEYFSGVHAEIQQRMYRLPKEIAKQLPMLFGLRSSYATPSYGHLQIELDDQTDSAVILDEGIDFLGTVNGQDQEVLFQSTRASYLMKDRFLQLTLSGETLTLGLHELPERGPFGIYFELEGHSKVKAVSWKVWTSSGWEACTFSDETSSFSKDGMVFLNFDSWSQCQKNESGIYLIRAEYEASDIPMIRTARLNVVPVVNLRKFESYCIGSGNGLPTQRFKLPKGQLVKEFRLKTRTYSGKDEHEWKEVDSFFLSEPGSSHYRVLSQSHEIEFGNGEEGAVAPPGYDNIWVYDLVLTDGVGGNLSKESDFRLKDDRWEIASIQPVGSFQGGTDAASQMDLLDHLYQLLGNRDRLISIEDFEFAPRLANRRIGHAFVRRQSHSELKVIPLLKKAYSRKPEVLDLTPTPFDLEKVNAYIHDRKPLNLKVVVSSPRYHPIAIHGEIFLEEATSETIDRIRSSILSLFNPLPRNLEAEEIPLDENFKKFQMGQQVNIERVIRFLERHPEVLRIQAIALEDLYHGKKETVIRLDPEMLPKVHLKLRFREVRL